ncbi:membrane protein containing Extracellular ligand-binding receptor domain protein [Candidatus Magnetomorum sp. HK-1]|nr:membrane protein containing Extracellular ligand-binding receptor domain protein [Candidatus Magnetomorum sp. HK-1]
MKKFIIFVSLFFLILVSIIIFSNNSRSFQSDLVIAAVTMGGKYKVIGQDMLSGINLYLDQLNANGGINGKRVKLDVYDDKGDRHTAIKVAMEIAKSNRALVVLGHYFSSTSLAASKVYLKSGIPAITGSATTENITKNSEWYFSISPNNHFQGRYIASYIKSSLGHKYCSVIYDSNQYGRSLFKNFKEKAHILGLEIKNTWTFDKNDPKYFNQMNKITTQLRAASDPGIIFLATHALEGAKIVSSLKYPGSNYEIFGPDSFSTNAFIQHLSKRPQEKHAPGYYSNGIYTTTPFLSDFVNDQNKKFIYDYMKKYKEKPTWVSACYYDAVHMAIKAMKFVEGDGRINQDRRIVKNTLAAKYNIDTSEKGVCGPLFFDKDRNVKFPLRVCVFKNQELIPDYFQYNIIANPLDDNSALKKILVNQLITSNNAVMDKTRIVFTGIHVNQIENFDIHKGTYDIDFFLWFRYKGEFEDQNIQFLNALQPIKLSNPMAEHKNRNIITRVYHIKEKFSSVLDFQAFPFETHDISIKFRHAKQTIDKLVYIPDDINEEIYNKLLKIDKQSAIQKIPKWTIRDMLTYNGVISYESSLGIPIQFHLKRPIVYSTCAANIKIKRDKNSYAIKVLSPAFVLLLVLFSASLIPFRFIIPFLFSFASVLILSGIFLFNSHMFFKLQYIVFVQYVYLSLLIGAATGIVFFAFILLISKTDFQKKILSLFSRIVTFIIIYGLLHYGYVSYRPIDLKRIIHIYTEPQKKVDINSFQ